MVDPDKEDYNQCNRSKNCQPVKQNLHEKILQKDSHHRCFGLLYGEKRFGRKPLEADLIAHFAQGVMLHPE